MKKQQKKYNVYFRAWTLEGDVGENKNCAGNGNSVCFQEWHFHTCNPEGAAFKECEKCWQFLGNVFAVSEKQAIARVCYRTGIDRYLHDDGHRLQWWNEFKAELAQ